MARSAYDDKRGPVEFDILSTAIYVGYADYMAGVAPATSAPAWTIKKITLTNGNPTSIAWTNAGAGIWDNRLTESYA